MKYSNTSGAASIGSASSEKGKPISPYSILMILNSLPRSAGVFMETRTSVRRLMVSISPPVVTQTISANGCVIAPATRLILSLLISPDGVIIPLSSRVFFIGFSFSSMVPVVPKWCPDVKNRVVKRKTATITRYKKSLCLQGFSQITYKKICGNTGRFWLFHDPRNLLSLTEARLPKSL